MRVYINIYIFIGEKLSKRSCFYSTISYRVATNAFLLVLTQARKTLSMESVDSSGEEE